MEREIIKALQKQTGLIVEIWADKFNPEYFEHIEEGQIVKKEEGYNEDDKPKRTRRTREQMEQARIEEEQLKAEEEKKKAEKEALRIASIEVKPDDLIAELPILDTKND